MRDTERCSTFLVRHAWLSMRSVLAEALAEHGLSVAQYASLMIIDKQPGLTVADVARRMSTARQSANEMLGGLERVGLIERQAHPHDRRAQQISLTDAGRARLAAAEPAVTAVDDALSAGFSAAELAVVRAWLDRMAAAAGDGQEELATM